MLRSAKLSLLRLSKSLALFRAVQNSRWRGRQLLILCYHGIALEDEHEWAPGLYMSPDHFEARLALLRQYKYSVLPLDEGLRRLYSGTLPPRSVVLTFDDGMFDFYRAAWPLLRKYGFPATVYLTTYYCDHNLPIFPLVCSYLLWKRRGSTLPAPQEIAPDEILDLSSPRGRQRVQNLLLRYADDNNLSGAARDGLARSLADRLGLDYNEIRSKRLLHIMNAAEVREVATAGADIQLHTHRHRSPLDREMYQRELLENGQRIRALTGTDPVHFCYPSGIYKPAFREWLAERGVVSATTCITGIANPNSEPLLLPRLLDHSGMSPLEFESWLTGFASVLPKRRPNLQDVDPQGKLIPRPEPTPA